MNESALDKDDGSFHGVHLSVGGYELDHSRRTFAPFRIDPVTNGKFRTHTQALKK